MWAIWWHWLLPTYNVRFIDFQLHFLTFWEVLFKIKNMENIHTTIISQCYCWAQIDKHLTRKLMSHPKRGKHVVGTHHLIIHYFLVLYIPILNINSKFLKHKYGINSLHFFLRAPIFSLIYSDLLLPQSMWWINCMSPKTSH